jgi:hypothetical protein
MDTYISFSFFIFFQFYSILLANLFYFEGKILKIYFNFFLQNIIMSDTKEIPKTDHITMENL